MNILKVFAGAGFLAIVAACGQNASADATTQTAEKPKTSEVDGDALGKVPSGTFKADQGHRYITFTYDHQGYSAPYIRWRDWDADLTWNAENPEQSTVSVTIDVASVDTGVDPFDDHLKSSDFFDVANHPEITFVSTGIEQTGLNTGVITGDLTIKGITKSVAIDAKFNKGDYNQRAKGHKLGFSGKTKVLRSDFAVDLAVPFVGDEVTIIIEAEFNEVTS